ncbi:hypothetical protein Hanom_Chr13g01187571 [Helianthus anomalus]
MPPFISYCKALFWIFLASALFSGSTPSCKYWMMGVIHDVCPVSITFTWRNSTDGFLSTSILTSLARC